MHTPALLLLNISAQDYMTLQWVLASNLARWGHYERNLSQAQSLNSAAGLNDHNTVHWLALSVADMHSSAPLCAAPREGLWT